jgi:hypothetical protein
MSEFNYVQLDTPILEAELKRVEATMEKLETKRMLIVAALGTQAVQTQGVLFND